MVFLRFLPEGHMHCCKYICTHKHLVTMKTNFIAFFFFFFFFFLYVRAGSKRIGFHIGTSSDAAVCHVQKQQTRDCYKGGANEKRCCAEPDGNV